MHTRQESASLSRVCPLLSSPPDQGEERLQRRLLEGAGLLPQELRELLRCRGQDGLEVDLEGAHGHGREGLEGRHAGHLVAQPVHEEVEHLLSAIG